MGEDFSILFEPVQIGPVVAPNRFYQVPHCNGMGYRMPQALAEMRRIKAEGGWGVVCTEEVEIHHSSDLSPNIEGRIWNDEDIPALSLMVDAVHQHGALAGIELTYGGHHASNLYSRVPSLGLRSLGVTDFHPIQTRCIDREDIRNIRRWHRAAALRAKHAGFDIIYCYASHNLSLAMHFLLQRYNDRSDEYGGNLENRVRFLRELIEDTKDAVGDTCAVAVRLAVDELLGEDGIQFQAEGHDIIAILAELPDLWDVNISDWSNDSVTSRFKKEGSQEPYVGFVKQLSSKPVVAVGRYTSPDAMLSVIRRGIADLVGAARPSIADPFLPNKIRENRLEDIRECIGCNICASADVLGVPIRCTQNPTMGEAWRRGWHPERIAPKKSDKKVLVVGSGPAGLECARTLGARGYEIILVESRQELGGRVIIESTLPGLSEWRRVIDWRLSQIEKMGNISVFPESLMTAEDILTSGFSHVIIATGAKWRDDGIGRNLWRPVAGHQQAHVCTPEIITNGFVPNGHLMIYDDDHYYMGSLLAQFLANMGCQVTLATPAPMVSIWSQFTLEYEENQKKLMNLGVDLRPQYLLHSIQEDNVTLSHAITGAEECLVADAVVLVTDRLPNDSLYQELKPALAAGRLDSLQVIGDAEAPNIIAQAVFSGHLAGREFEEAMADGTTFRIERVEL